MPNRFDISKINDIDEEEQLPSNDEFDNDEIDFEDLGERDYYEATHICNWCNGLDNYCSFCGGSGTYKRRF